MIQLLVPRRYRYPYGVFLHSVDVWNELSPLKLRALQSATVLVANSEYTAARVRVAHPDLRPIQVCPLALPPQAQDEVSHAGSADTELPFSGSEPTR